MGFWGKEHLFFPFPAKNRVEGDAGEEDDHRVAREGGIGSGDHPQAVDADDGHNRNHQVMLPAIRSCLVSDLEERDAGIHVGKEREDDRHVDDLVKLFADGRGGGEDDDGPRGGRHGWWRWWGPWYQHENLRDERAEAFTSLLWEGVHTYTYVTRATTPGSFVVPPTKAEEMYHPEVFGRGASDRVVVE